MPTPSAARRQSDPAVYCIHASGRFTEAFPEHFGGFSVEAFPTTGGPVVTEMTGPLADQTALLSLLQYLDDTGLVLLSVENIDPQPQRVAVNPTS
ncbi:MAG: hypothetical protein MUQ56_10880 [Thermoleophilia bacterium]|nr:hypothetical protein [Thermoleophilia bacterium]